VDNSKVQYLAKGETVTESFTVSLSDQQGSTVQQVVSVTITGTNDVPVVGTVATSATEAGSAVSINALVNASDVDAGTTLSVVDLPSTLPAGVTYDAATKTFSMDPSNSAYDYLAAGKSATVTVNYGEIRVGSVNFHRMVPVRMPPAIYLGISNAR
jgi:hypothetical protein